MSTSEAEVSQGNETMTETLRKISIMIVPLGTEKQF